MKLPKVFYTSDNVVEIAKELLGKVIFTKIDEKLTGGMITETEAYEGVIDRASHAYGHRRTSRTEVMYKNGGIAYVYLCYGVHFLFNFVTSKENIPHAVLLRGVYPFTGLEIMEERRGRSFREKDFTNGPGKVTSALGIDLSNNAEDLSGDTIWVEDRGIRVPEKGIQIGPRIGVSYAGKDALLPYRFLLREPGITIRE